MAVRTEIFTTTKLTLDKNLDKEKYEELLHDPQWVNAGVSWTCGESKIVGFIKEEYELIEEEGSKINACLGF